MGYIKAVILEHVGLLEYKTFTTYILPQLLKQMIFSFLHYGHYGNIQISSSIRNGLLN